MTTGLNIANDQPGYLLGRLHATLERLEAAATDTAGVDTTTFGRLGTAVGNPVITLGIARREAPGWLRRHAGRHPERPNWTADLQRVVAELVARIGDVGTLSGDSEQQSLFTVGYHHQRAVDMAGGELSTEQVARLLGVTADAARQRLSRWVRAGKLTPVRTGDDGRRWWPKRRVDALITAAPGRGVGGGRPRTTPADST